MLKQELIIDQQSKQILEAELYSRKQYNLKFLNIPETTNETLALYWKNLLVF